MLDESFVAGRFRSDGLSDKGAARLRMMRVPGGDAGCVSGDEDVVVDHVEGKTAIYVQVPSLHVRHTRLDIIVGIRYTGFRV